MTEKYIPWFTSSLSEFITRHESDYFKCACVSSQRRVRHFLVFHHISSFSGEWADYHRTFTMRTLILAKGYFCIKSTETHWVSSFLQSFQQFLYSYPCLSPETRAVVPTRLRARPTPFIFFITNIFQCHQFCREMRFISNIYIHTHLIVRSLYAVIEK